MIFSMIFDYLPRDQDHISNQCLPRRGKDRDRGRNSDGIDDLICFGYPRLLAEPGKARGCSTNNVVIHSFADPFLSYFHSIQAGTAQYASLLLAPALSLSSRSTLG